MRIGRDEENNLKSEAVEIDKSVIDERGDRRICVKRVFGDLY